MSDSHLARLNDWWQQSEPLQRLQSKLTGKEQITARELILPTLAVMVIGGLLGRTLRIGGLVRAGATVFQALAALAPLTAAGRTPPKRRRAAKRPRRKRVSAGSGSARRSARA
jgi:hypothetical protein